MERLRSMSINYGEPYKNLLIAYKDLVSIVHIEELALDILEIVLTALATRE